MTLRFLFIRLLKKLDGCLQLRFNWLLFVFFRVVSPPIHLFFFHLFVTSSTPFAYFFFLSFPLLDQDKFKFYLVVVLLNLEQYQSCHCDLLLFSIFLSSGTTFSRFTMTKQLGTEFWVRQFFFFFLNKGIIWCKKLKKLNWTYSEICTKNTKKNLFRYVQS